MSSYATMLENAKSALNDLLTNPKPTYTFEGKSVSWSEHRKQLMETIEFLEVRVQDETGPMEEVTYLL